MDTTTSLQRQIESLQKQLQVQSQKIDLILKEMGKVMAFEPEHYSLQDAEEEGEENEEE